ncbi:SHOCT domain-containing protein [Candidatus Bipolaricaulota bacterium]|nr:SHOCT domain-containing protein [Candidatus Bipolaricaulota bacterium]
MKGSTVVAVVIGALVVGFVGGIVGGLLFQQDGDVSGLESRIAGVESRLSTLEGRVAALPQEVGLKVAYVDAEELFMKVFLPKVDAERQAMILKQQEIQQLRARYLQGEISQEEYQQQGARLQVELLQAQLNVNLTMLDKMIASPGFANFRGDLERIRESARPLTAEVANLVQSAQLGIVYLEGFMATYQQLQAAFQQLDQLLSRVAAAKIVEIAQQVAREQGLDLVLRKKDVLIYYNDQKITDISGEVEGRLWGLFSSS